MIWFFSRGSFKSPNHQWLEIPWFLPIPSMYGTVYLPIWLFFNVLNMVFHVRKIYHSSHGMQNSGPLLGISPTRKSDGSTSFSSSIRLRRLPPLGRLDGVVQRWRTVLHSTIWRRQAPSPQWPVRPGPGSGTKSLGEEWSFWPILEVWNVSVMRRSHSGGRKGEKEKMFS